MFEKDFLEQLDGTSRRSLGRTDRPIACKILAAPKTFGEEIYVLVEDLGENARRGPCKWWPYPVAGGGEPRKPEGGEDAIIVFDSNGIPWITMWWPF